MISAFGVDHGDEVNKSWTKLEPKLRAASSAITRRVGKRPSLELTPKERKHATYLTNRQDLGYNASGTRMNIKSGAWKDGKIHPDSYLGRGKKEMKEIGSGRSTRDWSVPE